jgi:hypothetical protein
MRTLLGCLIFFAFFQQLAAQDIKIELGPDEVAENQLFTITVTVENERLREYSGFPEIEGLIKRGTSSSTSTSYINGRMTSTQSITQNYQPVEEGSVIIPDFAMTINGKEITVKGKTLKIGPAAQGQAGRSRSYDPFEDFFNRRENNTEFVDVRADAFLALSTDKPEVYVGEGFTTTLAFYVAETNRAEMRFYDLGNQITDIVKNIKPDNCWEENFNIDNIQGQSVQINGKGYTQYKIYQAAYYPLNDEDISFPSVDLKMIKYKLAKNPSFFGRNRQEDYETFSSKPKAVKVKQLPPHPLRDQVAVGNYALREEISSRQLETGQSFNYSFSISGEGNISSIESPMIPENDEFDFYEPNMRQNIRRSSNRVTGTKVFDYYGIPNEPGTYELSDYLQWIYFNPLRDQYDTLKSDVTVTVIGESRKNEYISSNDLGSFYDLIEFQDNSLQSLNGPDILQIIINVLIFAAIVGSAVVVFRKQ